MGNLDRKEEKKHLTHDTEFAACLIKRLCNYTHQGSALKGPVFLSRPVADCVWFKANISGVRKTSAQSPLKRSSLKTTQDIKRWVSHLNMIGCHHTRWVYSQHQGHHHLEHYTSAIKSASGQYLVIGPIPKKCLIYFDQQLIEPKAFTTYVIISPLILVVSIRKLPEEKQDGHMVVH